MSQSAIVTFPRPLLLTRKLALIVVVLVAIVGSLLFLVQVEMEILSGVRAYVAGEGLWSKGQKNAAQHLKRYAFFHVPADYEAYRDAIAVPMGDRVARNELEKATPDPRVVTGGFIEGGNHPDDVPLMAWLFRRFGRLPYMASAIVIWREADENLVEFERLGDEIHTMVLIGRATSDVLTPLLERIDEVDGRLTPLENGFSQTLGEGARQLKQACLVILWVAGVLLVGMGAFFAWMMLRHIHEGEVAYQHLVDDLENAGRLKSEFVSTVSHELRTPLNVILGYAEMARDPGADLGAEQCLDHIEDAGRDLLQLVETTLEVGRIEAGRDTTRLETVDLSALWHALGQGCARMPRRDGVTLEWDGDVPAMSLATDPRKLTMIVRNLVGNALKFTERGWVRAGVRLEGDALVVRVADSGIGIRTEDQQTIFDMFRQADGSHTRRFGGSGLGLYIVRRAVAQLAGTIFLDSAPGRGSTFTVTLPACATDVAAARAA